MKVTKRVRKIASSSEIHQDRNWEDLDFSEQIKVMKKFVRSYQGTKVFEDFAEHAGVDVEDIIDMFCDAEIHGDIEIPWKKQKDSQYANDDIYGSDMDERTEFRHIKTGKVYSLSQLKQLFKFKETRGYEGSFEDWLAAQLSSRKLVQVNKSTVKASNNYGGSYDLENEGFFTKDDLVEFDDEVIEILQECYPDTFRIDDSYIEDNIIYLSVQSSEGNWAEGSVKVDMRKIRKPSDILKYSNTMVGKLREELDTVYVESATTAVEGTMLPGPGDYDPPEYDEPVELGEIADHINVYLDDDIVLDIDGSWEYVDGTYQWACPNNNTRSWHSDEYGVYLDDCSGVAEKVDDLIVDLLPDEPGTYHVSGDVNLYYSITGIEEYRDYYRDEDGVSYDSTIVTDDADVYYVKEKSTLEDFKCVPTSSTSPVDSSTSIEGSNSIYDSHMTQDFRGVEYMIHYVGLDTSPSSDAQDLFNRFAAQVTEIHPYDDANYAWAKIQNGVIKYFKDGWEIDRSFYFTADDYEIDNSEWCQTVVDEAIHRLRDLNKDVKPRMVHN